MKKRLCIPGLGVWCVSRRGMVDVEMTRRFWTRLFDLIEKTHDALFNNANVQCDKDIHISYSAAMEYRARCMPSKQVERHKR